jgi:hypothetical protein
MSANELAALVTAGFFVALVFDCAGAICRLAGSFGLRRSRSTSADHPAA